MQRDLIMAFSSSLAFFFTSLTWLLSWFLGRGGARQASLLVMILTLQLLYSILYLGRWSSRSLWLVSISPVLSDNIQKKPANQPTITASPTTRAAANCTLGIVIYHSILLRPCFCLYQSDLMMLNYVMIHVKNNLPTSFLEIFNLFGHLLCRWQMNGSNAQEAGEGEGIKPVNGSSSESIIALSFKS